jgi:hypothetical protein
MELAPLDNWRGKYVTINAQGVPEPADLVPGTVSQSVIGQLLWPRTEEEIAAGVTPTNYAYPPGNVLRYGAVPDGVTDCLAAINKCIAANKRTSLPDGDFLISDSVVVPPGKVFLGSGYGTKLVASGISGAAVLLDGGYVGGGSDDPREVGRFRVTGTATIGVHCDDAQMLDLHDIWLNELTCTDGFVFEDTFGCSLWNLYTNGAVISNACFLCGQAFNANDCRNWYTSNYAYASLLLDATYNGGNGVAHGSTFSMICVQSTKYGIYVKAGQAHTFSGVYMESIVHPVRLGDYSAGLLARGISISGDFGGPYASHPDYAEREAVINFDYATGCTISGGEATGAYNCAAAAPLTFSGGGGSGASGIARVTANGAIHSVMLLTAGGGYSSAPTVTVGGAGSGGAVTATVSNGAVTGLSLDSPGSGYVPTYCPVLVKYNRSFRNEVGCLMFNSGLGEFSPMYPFVVRDAAAPTNCGVTLLHDVSLRASASAAASAEVRKTAGFGHTHAVIESASDGSRVAQVYTPPAYP